MQCLEDHNINSSSSWENALKLIKDELHFNAFTKASDRKQCFNEYKIFKARQEEKNDRKKFRSKSFSAKKLFGRKYFRSKFVFGRKLFSAEKHFRPKTFLVEKFSGRKFWPKMFRPKNFRSKIFWTAKFAVPIAEGGSNGGGPGGARAPLGPSVVQCTKCLKY